MNPSKPCLIYRFVSLLLCILLVFTTVSVPAFAEGEPKKGYVLGSGVNVRSFPSTVDSQVYTTVDSDQVVWIHGEETDAKGGIWYHVTFTKDGGDYDGYISSTFVAYATDPGPVNPNFEAQLAAFPESYHASLRALYELHPSWNYVAFNTGLDWNYIQELENRLGYSYIDDGIISHYSTEPGSYDWETDTYFVKEGSNWYQAHPAMVAYYMDPRNFINQNDIFQFELLSYDPATQTEENVASMLQGTFMEGKTTLNYDGVEVSYARAFLDAATAYSVSAFHLVTRCIQEVGTQGSPTVHGQFGGEYNGYYNFFNIGAYTGATDGMIYAKDAGWDTPYRAIVEGGKLISSGYISRGQNTPYYQKFNVVDSNNPATHQYMTNIRAPQSEGKKQKAEYQKLGYFESSFTFSIPVYQNMPEAPCAVPEPAGSPNNYLKNLWIDGYSISPTFDFYDTLNSGRTRYDLIIPGDAYSVNVGAVPVSASAAITGHIGNIMLASGENLLTIICTAANGASRNYTIRILVQGQGGAEFPPAPPEGAGEVIPSGWNVPYRIQGSNLSGITPGMNSDAFIASLGTYGKAYAYLADANGYAFSGTLRTGLVLYYFDGYNFNQYQIVLYGDVNGDSVTDAIDLLLVRKTILGLHSLDGANNAAGDVNRDGVVDAIDLLLVRKHILGLNVISQ